MQTVFNYIINIPKPLVGTHTAHLMLFLLMVCLCPGVLFAQDRFTMNSGEIFIASIQKIENDRYYVKRNDLVDVIPTWWVKKLEEDETTLPIAAGDLILTPTSRPELAGKKIQITSREPVETSHLEMFPAWTHYWRQSGTYLRGYLVNKSGDAYKRIRVRLTYYQANGKVAFQQETEVFNVYAKTMMPFIVDTRSINWRRVERLDFRPVATVNMTP